MNLLPFQVSSKTLLKILEIWQWHQKHWILKANNVYLLKPADQWPQSAITIYLLGFQNKWIMNWKNGKLDICHPFLPVLSFTQFNLILENLKKVGNCQIAVVKVLHFHFWGFSKQVRGQLVLKTVITANSNVFKLFCSNILLSSVKRGIFSQSGHFLLHCNSALISCLSHLAGKSSLTGSLSPEYEKYIFVFSSDSVLVPSSYLFCVLVAGWDGEAWKRERWVWKVRPQENFRESLTGRSRRSY